jgi:N-acetyl-beta-hexosaminidase
MFKLWMILVLFSISSGIAAQQTIDSLFPVRGFAIGAPSPDGLDSFLLFINDGLAKNRVNTLILRVDYNYQYKSHPELVGNGALSTEQVKRIVKACRQNNISIIPQINLLGHQSWASQLGKLLQVYPQFDETPHIKLPAKYEWPNKDSLYCKSYCPLHPDVHKVVFELVDEICAAFESTAFHAGMDEVFYIGDARCPRCSGKSKAELFAGEVSKINAHLKKSNRKLWIWGDRLLDGKTTGLGMWEASFNNTHGAVDLIPKEVVICDWHYDRADKTAVYFAMKGFHVVTCSWQKPEVAIEQVRDMANFRRHATREMKPRFAGLTETVWSSSREFINGYYKNLPGNKPDKKETAWECFRAMFRQMEKESDE